MSPVTLKSFCDTLYLKLPANTFSPRGLRLDASSTAWFVVSKPRIVFGLSPSTHCY